MECKALTALLVSSFGDSFFESSTRLSRLRYGMKWITLTIETDLVLHDILSVVVMNKGVIETVLDNLLVMLRNKLLKILFHDTQHKPIVLSITFVGFQLN
jgi:hypothetical protein